jgi:hypothetical protein
MGRRKHGGEAFEQISIRVPTALLVRADKLAESLAALPAHAHERLTRGAVIRLAVARGIAALERDEQPRS